MENSICREHICKKPQKRIPSKACKPGHAFFFFWLIYGSPFYVFNILGTSNNTSWHLTSRLADSFKIFLLFFFFSENGRQHFQCFSWNYALFCRFGLKSFLCDYTIFTSSLIRTSDIRAYGASSDIFCWLNRGLNTTWCLFLDAFWWVLFFLFMGSVIVWGTSEYLLPNCLAYGRISDYDIISLHYNRKYFDFLRFNQLTLSFG